MRGTITCASPLSPEELMRFENKFTAMMGKLVLFDVRVDPRLIGGVLVELEGRMWDGTLRGRLQQARQLMLREE